MKNIIGGLVFWFYIAFGISFDWSFHHWPYLATGLLLVPIVYVVRCVNHERWLEKYDYKAYITGKRARLFLLLNSSP